MILPDITNIPAIEWESGKLSYAELSVRAMRVKL